MSGRLDRSADNALIKRITDLESNIEQLNSFQRLGSKSAIGYRIYSANAYDVQILNVPAFSVGYFQTITVTFTPSSSTFSNSSFVHRMFYTYTQDLTNGNTLTLRYERLLPVGNQQVWKIYVQSFSTFVTAYLQVKLYFFTNGSGTFSSTVL
jgi:hypothetical protein